jgi:3-oxoacyl-[acyl-carrier protein] reductase
MTIKGKTVLITGGAIGIGEAISREFAKQGANVIINYNRSEKEAVSLVKELTKNYEIKAISIKADLSDSKEVENLFKLAAKQFSSIDILINNAGYSLGHDFLTSERGLWLKQYENNFLSSVECSQHFLSLENKGLRKIINISSIFGFDDKSDPEFMQYSASKAALNSFTKNLAKKFAPNVLVNAIAPGYVLTPQWETKSEQIKKDCMNETLIKRFIKPGEVSDAALFLAKNDAMTGTILLIDGGLALKS